LFGLKADILGFGNTHYTDNTLILQKATVNILSNRECENKVAQITHERRSVFERYLCSFAEPYVQIGDVSIDIFNIKFIKDIVYAIYKNVSNL
jgi:hypothetical protein